MFKRDSYKLSMFHILAEYSKKYYEEGLKLPKSCSLHFQQAMEESDPYAEFFDDNIVNNEKGLLSKRDAMEAIEMWKKFKNVPEWVEVKNEFQRRGYKYDSQKKKNKQKGFFIGCSLKEEEDSSGEDD